MNGLSLLLRKALGLALLSLLLAATSYADTYADTTYQLQEGEKLVVLDVENMT